MFVDRADAGRRLAERLSRLKGEDVVVVGLPRGGLPVAFEVATALGADLDVISVRKLGVPFQPEWAMGAVGEGGMRFVNDDVVRKAGVTATEFAAVESRERAEVERRARALRGTHRAVPLTGRTVVVVDDGIATGSTVRAACQVARAAGARRVIVAVPVGPDDVVRRLAGAADEVVCLAHPANLWAVGQAYADFSQVSDEQVAGFLRRAAVRDDADVQPARPDPPQLDVIVPSGPMRLSGQLTVPAAAKGLVVFAHGSGSSRHSPRNRFVADALNDVGLGTMLFDLLTADEELDRSNVFDIALLGRRLGDVTRWVRDQPGLPTRIGYFGASTGAAAALYAAADREADIAAIVSRGGRPDLAGPWLSSVTAPTLLIVGGRDDVVLGLNRDAQLALRCPSRLAIVPGATHLFEEPGALRDVTRLACDWFLAHLPATTATFTT